VREPFYEDPIPRPFRRVMFAVHTERQAQERKWGPQNHDPATWALIQAEEVGEAEKEALEAWVQRDSNPNESTLSMYRHREELIQVAAVAIARIECLDRELWKWAKGGEG